MAPIPRRKVRLPPPNSQALAKNATQMTQTDTNTCPDICCTNAGRLSILGHRRRESESDSGPTPVYRGRKSQNNKLRNPNAQLQSINGIMRQSPRFRVPLKVPVAVAVAVAVAIPVPSSTVPGSSPSTDALPYRHKFRSTSLSGLTCAVEQVAAAACRLPHATCQTAFNDGQLPPPRQLMRELLAMPMSKPKPIAIDNGQVSVAG